MKRKQKLWLVLAVAALIALVISGCGSSSESGSRSAASQGATDHATADVELGTNVYDADSYETEDGYAADASETAEVAEESMESSADSGASSSESAMDAETLTDADAIAVNEADTGETAGESKDEETGEASVDSSYEQKLIRTVNLTAETTEFDKAVASVKAKTEELGGYVESSEMNTSTASTSRWAYLTLRIPADGLDAFLEQVEGEMNVTYSTESTEDVTLTYSDMESHVAALRTEQETLLSMLEQATSMEDILAIQSQLTEVRYEIESYESQLKVYDNKVNYSTVYLELSEVVHETSGTGITFGEQVGNRFSASLYNIAHGFRNFAIGFLGAVPYLIILAVVVVICVFGYKKVRKIQKKLHDKKFAKHDNTED